MVKAATTSGRGQISGRDPLIGEGDPMRLSLRYKFMLAFLGFSVIVAVAFGVLTTQRLNNQLKAQYEQQALKYARHAAEEAVEGLIFEVGHDLDTLAEHLWTEELGYVQIVLYGNMVSQKQRFDINLATQPPSTQILITEFKPSQADANHLDIIYPFEQASNSLSKYGRFITPQAYERLINGGDSYVRVGFSLQPLKQELQQESLLLIGLSLGLMALGILCSWILFRMILGPIEHLSDTMRAFGSGRVSVRTNIHSGDEIEMLANEFNTMAHSIVYQRDILRRTNVELKKANHAKSDFLTTISHELRTPLHSVLGFASLLRDEVNVTLSKAGHQYTDAILRAGKHLLALIENLIEFSRLEGSSEPLHCVYFNAAEVVDEVLESQRPLLLNKGLKLVVDVAPSLPVKTDKTKLRQVLLNLIDNAIKYTDCGQVRVFAERRNHSIYFSVSDTGIGVALQDQNRLFEPFTRAERTGRNRQGMGLGLTVVNRYVDLMGGTLAFDSALGEGSHFWFALPLAHQALPTSLGGLHETARH